MPKPAATLEQRLAGVLARLDGCRPDQISTSWLRPVARSLARLDQSLADRDRRVCSHLGALLLDCGQDLAALSQRSGFANAIPASGTQLDHPVSVTLAAAARSRDEWPPPTPLLLAILCELALRGADRREVDELGQRIRGGLAEYGIKLAPALGTATSLAGMVRGLDAYQKGLTSSSTDPAAAFMGTWRRWLFNRVSGWLTEDPAWLAAAYRPVTLLPDLDAAAIDTAVDLSNPDDALAVDHLPCDPVDPHEAPRSTRTERARARASHLLRGTDGELLLPPDFVLPGPRAAEVIALAIQRARQAAVDGGVEAEPMLAIGFLAATGIRELDLGRVRWGNHVDAAERWALDPVQPLFRRFVARPAQAFSPPEAMQTVLAPTTDVLAWPIPSTLHALLVQCAPHTRYSTPFPRAASRIGAYRLADVLREMTLGTTLGAQPFRRAMAAHLAQWLGPDVAQLALGDAFSVSVAPTYYTAATASQVWKAVAPLLAAWFREPIGLEPPTDAATFGSRVVLTKAAAATWPASLGARRWSVARRKGQTVVDGWIAHRNSLAAGLCAVTGHRPTQALGQLDLQQVIPEYNLILLQDKQVDPLRKLRIAGTGGHWTQELRCFLDRLQEIGARNDDAGSVARRILAGNAPLFSVPGAEGARELTAAELRATMPTPLDQAANHYRHRLNQQLLAAGVDPELRFGQLGWVVSSAYATADLSPHSAADLGRELTPILDAYLEAEGWYTPRQRVSPWTWQGLPAADWMDWNAIAQTQAAVHGQVLARVRAELRERGRSVLESMWPRVQAAIAELLPVLEVVLPSPRLKRRVDLHGHSEPILISEDLCSLLLDRVRSEDRCAEDALEGVMARAALAKLFRQSHRNGLTQGYLPRAPILAVTAQPSPFLPGCGHAVRQVTVLRQLLADRARQGFTDDQGYLSYFGVLLDSPYRTIRWARAAVEAAGRAVRSPSPGDLLRVPAHVDRHPVQMLFAGAVALQLARRGLAQPSAHAPTDEQAEDWLRRVLKQAGHAPATLALVASTAQAAARIELSGPERVQLLGEVRTLSAPVERCLARDADWPPRTAVVAQEVLDPIDGVYAADDIDRLDATSERIDAVVPALRKLLHPERFGAERSTSSDSHRGWRGALRKQLARLPEQLALRRGSNAWLLVRYAQHRTEYGGERKKRLAHQTIYNDVLRIAERLLAIAGARTLIDQDETGLEAIYRGVLEATRASQRPEIAETLHRFHHYLEQFHQGATLSWTDLSAFAGQRVDQPDPGLLTTAELRLVEDQLHRDLDTEQQRVDAAPERVRLAELRILLFAILAGSGIRPRSARGLLLSDLGLYGPEGDWVHVHRTGGYGIAKTSTSIGFVPLLGPVWTQARGWIADWLARERAQVPADLIAKSPLFAYRPGARRRFHRTLLERRIAELIRWACAESRAHPYWLRKTWVTERHREVSFGADRRARDAYKVLCESGHAAIHTPLAHYIADPAVVVAHSVVSGRSASRAQLLAASGLPPGPLDAAWHASRATEMGRRVSVALDTLGHPPAAAPAAAIGEPPALVSKGRLLPIDVERYARARHRAGWEEAVILSGLTQSQGQALEQAAGELLLLRGLVLWPIEGLAHPRAVLRVPRAFGSAERLLRSLKREPDAEALWLADRWAQSAHAERVGARTDEVLTIAHEEAERACNALVTLGAEGTAIQSRRLTLGTALRIERQPAKTSDLSLTDSPSIHWILAQLWLWSRAFASAPA